MLLLETKTLQYGTIKFIINQDRLYIQTPLQTFLLEATEYHWRTRLKRISLMVELGHIRSYSDLFEHLNGQHGKTGQTVEAIRLVPVKQAWIR